MHIDDQKEIYSLEELPRELRSFKLPGHHYGMIGIRTSDGVYYIADTLGSKELVDKQHILLIYDVGGYLKSLEYVESLDGNILVPAHSEVTSDIKDLVIFNRNKIYEIIEVIINILKEEHTLEEIVSLIFENFQLKISYNKYLLITSTIRSYLAYLANDKRIRHYFKCNKLYYIIN